MTSSYSTDLKLELMVTGENAGTWGDKTNTNLNLLQQAIAGYQAVSIAGGAQTTALVMSNATISNARNAIVKLTGTITGNQVVTIPDGIEKTYIVENGTSGAFTVEFKTVSGTGPTFSTTDKGIKIVYSDGTNVVDVNANFSASSFPEIKVPQINDSNGNEEIKFTTTASAVNELTVTNAATGNAPEISATGGDTNIDLKITPKGSGKINLDGIKFPNADGSNGQVLSTDGSGNLAFTTISSNPTQLVSSIPLASGGSVTAGRATFINSSGEVALYPTLNTVGTEYSNSSATVYTAISNNGSRAIKVSISGTFSFTATYTGVAITGTATPTNGGTTVTSTVSPPNNSSNLSTVTIYPISDTEFYVCHGAYQGFQNFGANTGCNTKNFIITVDASGNCTKGTEVNVNSSNLSGSFGNSAGFVVGKIKDDIFALGVVATIDYTQNWTYRTITISGTTVTATADNEVASFMSIATGFNTVYTTNNIIGCGSDVNWLTAAYTAGNIGTVTTTATITDNNTSPVWSRITNSRVLVYYQDTSLLYKLRTYDVNQTTGALTLVDTEFLTGTAWASSAGNFRFKDQTSGVFKYLVSGFYYINSISLDSSGNFIGFNLGSQISTGDLTPVYNTSNDFFINYFSSTPKLRKYTVNAYTTGTPNYLGVAKTTDSTSPVDIVTNGVAAGFTGLTAGTLYYVSTNYDGTVSTDSTSGILVGKAVSATEILMQRSNTQ